MDVRRRGTGATCQRAGCRFLVAFILSFGAPNMTPLWADEVFLIAPQVWQGFEDYKRQKQPKIFAVSADGMTYGYSYCREYRCKLSPDARTIALNSCAQGGGKACYVFAVGTDIKVQYRVVGTAPGETTVTGSRTNCERAADLLRIASRAVDPVEASAYYQLAEMAEHPVWTKDSKCDLQNRIVAKQARRSLSRLDSQRVNRIIDDWLGQNDLYEGVALKPQIFSDQGLLDYAIVGNASAVQQILRRGIGPNVRSLSTGATPLILSAGAGWRSTVNVLIAAGADVNLRDNSGKSALDRAAGAGHTEIVKRLRQAGAK